MKVVEVSNIEWRELLRSAKFRSAVMTGDIEAKEWKSSRILKPAPKRIPATCALLREEQRPSSTLNTLIEALEIIGRA